MTEKTARNYRDDQRLPSQRRRPRDYRTRLDPFVDVWANVQRKLEDEPALKAKTLFEWLQETDPRSVPGFHEAHVRAARLHMAESSRAEQDSLLQPDSSSGPTGCERLHGLQRPRRDNRQSEIRPHTVSLRADIQQCRSSLIVFFGIV